MYDIDFSYVYEKVYLKKTRHILMVVFMMTIFTTASVGVKGEGGVVGYTHLLVK